MSFRKIRPSFGDSSTSTNPQSTPETSGSDPRRAQKEAESSTSKRRRVPESVTRNACLNCKKARAKVCGLPDYGVRFISGALRLLCLGVIARGYFD
jgi:hypothetical protein